MKKCYEQSQKSDDGIQRNMDKCFSIADKLAKLEQRSLQTK